MPSDPARKPSKAVLERALRRLALDFARQIVRELESLGAFETKTHSGARPKPPSRRRRTGGALESLSAELLALVAAESAPVAIGQLAERLGVDRRALTHPLTLLVTQGKLARTGTRRGARYEATASTSDARRRGTGARRRGTEPRRRTRG